MFHSGLCSCAEALQWAFSASLVFRALCFLGPETDFSGNLFCVTAVSTLDVSGKTLWCLSVIMQSSRMSLYRSGKEKKC